MKHKIVEQAVRWLEKMGIEVEHNEELQEFEFEYKGAFMIIHTDTPEGVLSFTCPYVFPDEVLNENKAIFEMAKCWWSEYIFTEHCFCEFVDNDCAFVCCLYDRNNATALRKTELIEMLNDAVSKWELFSFAISIAEKTVQMA